MGKAFWSLGGRAKKPETRMWTPGMPSLGYLLLLLPFIWDATKTTPGAVKSAPCRTQNRDKGTGVAACLSLVSWMIWG